MAESLLVRLQRPDGTWVEVGALYSRDNTNWFESFDAYWSLAGRPVLGQVFESREALPSTHVALPRWFSHLLPEGRLRQAVADAAHVSPATEFQLMARLGSDDLPGALQALPWDPDSGVVAPAAEADDGAGADADPVLKFSLAGAQLKFSVHDSDRGLTVPVRGTAGNLIVKLPDPRPGFTGVPEAEHAAMTLARATGLDTPNVRLLDARRIHGLGKWADEAQGLSFAIDRYDRVDDVRRLHAEEFAQIMGVSPARAQSKYEHANFETIANIAAQLTGVENVGVVIDRIVLNVLVGNGDAHLKNWSVTYPDGMNPSLSPLYDVVPTVLYIPTDDLGLKLNGSRSFEDVTPASFERIGERTGFGAGAARRRAADAAMRVLDSWKILKESMINDHYRRLTDRIETLAIAKTN